MNTLMLLVLALSLGSVEGIVTMDGTPLPGATVTLTGKRSATTSANVEGRYRFENVTPGSYKVQVTMQGMHTATRKLVVRDGANKVETIALQIDMDEALTTSCSACTETPSSVYDFPSCKDLSFDYHVIDRIHGGDRAAIALAEQRFANAVNYRQKVTLAGALLGKVANDKPYWRFLHEHASAAVRFASAEDEPPEEYKTWCAERKLDVNELPQIAKLALEKIQDDPRARALLTRAVGSANVYVVQAGIFGLATQKDLSALPLIERALTRFPTDAKYLAEGLLMYGTAEADRLAFKYLDETQRASYRRSRGESNP